MIIEKIDIKSFGRITDMTLNFSNTVNVIEGDNEAGKSTIAAFIKYMLFGFDSAESEERVSERRKRINWQTGTAAGSMLVTVKGKKYLISRSTTPSNVVNGRMTYKEECSIIDVESGNNAFGKMPAGEVFFGVNRELFENTAFLGQIGDSSINEGSVKESIENILFSGAERLNNQRACAKIREKMDGIIREGGQSGVVAELKRKHEELQAAMERSDEDNKQILAKEAELYHIRRDRADAEEKLNGLYDLNDCYKNVMLIQTFDKLHELEEDALAKSNAYDEFINDNTRAGFVPTEQYLTDIATARRNVNDAYHNLGERESDYEREKNSIGITREIEGAIELSDAMGGEEALLNKANGLQKGFMYNIIFSVLCGLGLIATLVYELIAKGVLAHIAFRVIGAVLGVAALAGIGIFVYKFVVKNKALAKLAEDFGVVGFQNLKGKIAVIAEARSKRDGMISSTESARVALDEARIAYDNAKTELTRVIVRWGEEPPTQDLNDFLNKLELKVSSFLEKKNIIFEEKQMAEITVKDIRRTLADKNEINVRAQVSPLKRKSLSNINHDQIITGIALFKSKIADQDRKAFDVENELITLKARAGDPAEYHAKMIALEEKIEALTNKHKAYFVALKALETASDNLRAGISPRLGEFSTDLMSIMTDKKYTDFDVTGGLKVSYTADDGDKKSIDFLSGGTRDLAYVAVRMALIDMLYTEKPPICFDESFAHQDNTRANSMMKAIGRLSKDGYQSFICTCHDREAALASKHAKKVSVFKLA